MSEEGLTVIPGGWPKVAHPRREFGPSNDDLYQEQLQACRLSGHDLELGFESISGRETLICSRCDTRFVEVLE